MSSILTPSSAWAAGGMSSKCRMTGCSAPSIAPRAIMGASAYPIWPAKSHEVQHASVDRFWIHRLVFTSLRRGGFHRWIDFSARCTCISSSVSPAAPVTITLSGSARLFFFPNMMAFVAVVDRRSSSLQPSSRPFLPGSFPSPGLGRWGEGTRRRDTKGFVLPFETDPWDGGKDQGRPSRRTPTPRFSPPPRCPSMPPVGSGRWDRTDSSLSTRTEPKGRTQSKDPVKKGSRGTILHAHRSETPDIPDGIGPTMEERKHVVQRTVPNPEGEGPRDCSYGPNRTERAMTLVPTIHERIESKTKRIPPTDPRNVDTVFGKSWNAHIQRMEMQAIRNYGR